MEAKETGRHEADPPARMEDVNYEGFFADRIADLKDEDRYPHLRRPRTHGRQLPARQVPFRRRDQGDHRVVRQRLSGHGPARRRPRRHAPGPRCVRRRRRRHAQHLGHQPLPRAPGARSSPTFMPTEAALLFTSGWTSRTWAALGTLGAHDARLRQSFSDAKQPRLDDRGHQGDSKRRAAHLPPQRPRRPRPQAAAQYDPGRPKIVAFESVYSMDGDIAPIAEICRRGGGSTEP